MIVAALVYAFGKPPLDRRDCLLDAADDLFVLADVVHVGIATVQLPRQLYVFLLGDLLAGRRVRHDDLDSLVGYFFELEARCLLHLLGSLDLFLDPLVEQNHLLLDVVVVIHGLLRADGHIQRALEFGRRGGSVLEVLRPAQLVCASSRAD